MSVADQINRIKTNIANTYTAAQAKGATMPQTQNSDNLATCVQSITTGGGGGTQFGLTAEQMLGTVDSNGILTMPTLPSITFTGVKYFSNGTLYYKFYKRDFEPNSEVNFPDLKNASGNANIVSCFRETTGLTKAYFPALESMDNNSFQYVFSNSDIQTVSFQALTTINSNSMSNCFAGCSNLIEVDFPALSTMNYITSLNYAFSNCSSLTTISFPSLITVQTSSFGNATYNYSFNNCTALTEIHFRADMQATIEALTGYADKWGATNATIYFDL